MLAFSGVPETMRSWWLVLVAVLPHAVSVGRCHGVSSSICWMSRDDALQRKNGSIWLNDTALKSIQKAGKVASLSVDPTVEHRLTLQYGGSAQTWTITVTPRTKSVKIRGRQKPSEHPTNATKAFLDSLSPAEVFACENATLFFHQDENFFLATGHTTRLPVHLSSRSSSMLLVSWEESHPAVSYCHNVTLYQSQLGSYNALGVDMTTDNHYRFSHLDSCTPYLACVEIDGTRSFTCLSAFTEKSAIHTVVETCGSANGNLLVNMGVQQPESHIIGDQLELTDPDIPRDFVVTSWSSHSVSLAWDCPEKHKCSVFLLTFFYFNGTDHITEEVSLWYTDNNFVFAVSDLQPCSRVTFGLQAVCHAGLESRYSKMVLNDGNSALFNIEALHQVSFGPDSYSLSWEVRNASSISAFRVYHEGLLQGTTLATSYTVRGLLPCQQYKATVEALCGDGVIMSAETITAHTGPQGVTELRFRSNNSTALWTPGTTQRPSVAFVYELSWENGTTIQSSRMTRTELHLPELEEGKTYVLDVWEECDGHWESDHSYLYIEGDNSSLQLLGKAAGPCQDLELPMDLTLIVPWPLPDDLLDDTSEPRAKMEKIFKDKLQELLKDSAQPVHVELASAGPASEPHKTEILFVLFNASATDQDVPLSAQSLLDYIRSLNATNITVADGVIQWDGPDLCASSNQPLCPLNSVCINTLGSYTCVCQQGYYDVGSLLEPPVASPPVCNENGIFSQCQSKMMLGGVAKPYLVSYFGGNVDVKLNDGRCAVNEHDIFYYFNSSHTSSHCGAERRVNDTHIEFQNTLSVTLTTEQIISRQDLRIIWKCAYPRVHGHKTQVGWARRWFSSLTLVKFSSSLQLTLTMTLHRDQSYEHRYHNSVELGPEDTLFFQVALQTNSSFASGVLLQVESCWSTESPDPQDPVQGVFLQDGCPVDHTFIWLSANGLQQSSRFSIQMFNMPQGLPLYFHCVANICGHDEDCTKNCSSQQRSRRSVSQQKHSAVVSAGPLVVNARGESGARLTDWTEHMTVIFIVAGSMGLLGLTVLSVSAAKAIMTYYEQLRQQ